MSCLDGDYVRSLDVSVISCEGVEERLYQTNKPVRLLSNDELDSLLKYKYNYVVNIDVIFQQGQYDNTFKRLVDGRISSNNDNQCIVDRSVGGDSLCGLIKINKIYYHLENVAEDNNPISSWKDIHMKSVASSTVPYNGNSSKKMGSVLIVENSIHRGEEVEDVEYKIQYDSHLESYLQKRFLSPRIDCHLGLPQPLYLHTMDFSKLLTYVDFVSKKGLYYDSIDVFYKRYCSAYPDEVTSSHADFENFKHLTKEFIHLLNYSHTNSFIESPLLCGLNKDRLHYYVISVTLSCKLYKKYANNPHEYLLNENVSYNVCIILKMNNKYNYTYGWNNYDVFCVSHGLFKYGLDEWESIVKDETIWKSHIAIDSNNDDDDDDIDLKTSQKRLASSKEKISGESIVDMLYNKMVVSSFIDDSCHRNISHIQKKR